MSGFISIERDIWDHPLFANGEMTEREAFMWMIARAAWADTRHKVGSELVEVKRGSFVTTLRELQGVFMWKSDKRVRTFLKSLENNDMIGRTTVGTANAPKTHVTICNYEVYQSGGRTKDAPKTHDGRTTDAVKEQGNNKTTEEEANASLSADPTFPDLAHVDEIAVAVADYNRAAAQAGWPEVRVLSKSRRASLKARMRDAGGIEGWRTALDRARASPHLCGNNDRGWTASFDFLVAQSSFTKLMEGNYDPRKSSSDRRPLGSTSSGGSGSPSGLVGAAMRSRAARGL